MAAAGAAGGDATNVENVFSTYLYEGNSSTQTITNGIDLSGEGGLVWLKHRELGYNHYLWDTERGTSKTLQSSSTLGEFTPSISGLTSFNSNGFTLNDTGGGAHGGSHNFGSKDYVSWTFRKAPKFFDIVTFSGNSTNRTISHNLGTAPGFMVVKRTSGDGTNWMCFHRSVGATKGAILNGSNTFSADSTTWNNTAPTSSVFSLGTDGNVNKTGHDYVAYLWAHNNSDGEFGSTGDQDIIKCGSYTGNNSTDGPTIDLGFEPQWVMVKHTTNQYIDWYIFDNMRAFTAKGINANKYLRPNSTGVEDGSQDYITPRPDGFQVHGTGSHTNANAEYVYIAIRRGLMATPTSASDVFEADLSPNSNNPRFISGFPVDIGMQRSRSSSGVDGMYITSRLTQGKSLLTGHTNAEAGTSSMDMDYMNGFDDDGDTATNHIAHMWRRAPGFCDVVCYAGSTTTPRTISHNLGVAPEMIWIKGRDAGGGQWYVYHAALGNQAYGRLDESERFYISSDGVVAQTIWNATDPTASVFSLGNASQGNSNDQNFIAYLFATLAGISKVGSYTGDGTTDGSKVINCGFSNGAKFVLVKCSSHSGDWAVFDTQRGIVAGNDPALFLNTTSAENNSFDVIDPHSSGFAVNDNGGTYINESGRTYIFYAVAA